MKSGGIGDGTKWIVARTPRKEWFLSGHDLKRYFERPERDKRKQGLEGRYASTHSEDGAVRVITQRRRK